MVIQTNSTSPQALMIVSTQTKEGLSRAIRQYEEDIVVHKAITDKAKERYEAQTEAEKIKKQGPRREAELSKMLHEQTA